jgi:hypothetical protein
MNAAECFVFIVDLPPDKSTESGLDGSYYFTRCWTLQELLAPANVKFYDRTWGFRGSKIEFATAISQYTGIPSDVLGMRRSLLSYSVAARISISGADTFDHNILRTPYNNALGRTQFSFELFSLIALLDTLVSENTYW